MLILEVLEIIKANVEVDNSSAPNSIGDQVYELCLSKGIEEKDAEKFSQTAQMFAADFVDLDSYNSQNNFYL